MAMTKQEALKEFKDHVHIADWADVDYVDCVSKEALKVAIEVLEKSEFTSDRRSGYQPSKSSSNPPAPPTSGSNAVKPD